MIPGSEEQLAFLLKLQRLFAEGEFAATYKFALLISMADLAVEVGHDDDRPLSLSHRQLAAKFIELYWQQTMPYSPGRGAPAVLSQNNGAQAAIVSAIASFRTKHPTATLQSGCKLQGFQELLRRVAETVADQPVRYLQNLGGKADPFLYERERGAIVLKAGITYCLRRFQPLVQQLARSGWVDHIKGNTRNLPVIGDQGDLESFLFETPRQALKIIGTGLRKLSSRCFYCGSPVGDELDVDHFVPFSLYPRDLIHNFVLTHASCNRSKSNALAARSHLERWAEYIERRDDDLKQIAEAAGRSANVEACRMVARWGYTNAAQSGGQAWLKKAIYEPVDQQYLKCLV